MFFFCVFFCFLRYKKSHNSFHGYQLTHSESWLVTVFDGLLRLNDWIACSYLTCITKCATTKTVNRIVFTTRYWSSIHQRQAHQQHLQKEKNQINLDQKRVADEWREIKTHLWFWQASNNTLMKQIDTYQRGRMKRLNQQ